MDNQKRSSAPKSVQRAAHSQKGPRPKARQLPSNTKQRQQPPGAKRRPPVAKARPQQRRAPRTSEVGNSPDAGVEAAFKNPMLWVLLAVGFIGWQWNRVSVNPRPSGVIVVDRADGARTSGGSSVSLSQQRDRTVRPTFPKPEAPVATRQPVIVPVEDPIQATVPTEFRAGIYEGFSTYSNWYRHPLRMEISEADSLGRFEVTMQSLDIAEYRTKYSGVISESRSYPIQLRKKEVGRVRISDRDGPRWALNQNLTRRDDVHLRAVGGKLTGYSDHKEQFYLEYRDTATKPAPVRRQHSVVAAKREQPASSAPTEFVPTATATDRQSAPAPAAAVSSAEAVPSVVSGWDRLKQGQEWTGNCAINGGRDDLPLRITVLETRPDAGYVRVLIAHRERPDLFVIYDSGSDESFNPDEEFRLEFRSGGPLNPDRRNQNILTGRMYSRAPKMTCQLLPDGKLKIASHLGEKFTGIPVDTPRELLDTSRDKFAEYLTQHTARHKRFYGVLENAVGDSERVQLTFYQDDPDSKLCQAVLVVGAGHGRNGAAAAFEGHRYVDSDRVNGWAIVLKKIRVVGLVPRSTLFNPRWRKTELRLRLSLDGSGKLYAAALGMESPGDRQLGRGIDALERITFEPAGVNAEATPLSEEERDETADAALRRAQQYEEQEFYPLAVKYYGKVAEDYADMPQGKQALKLLSALKEKLAQPDGSKDLD